MSRDFKRKEDLMCVTEGARDAMEGEEWEIGKRLERRRQRRGELH